MESRTLRVLPWLETLRFLLSGRDSERQRTNICRYRIRRRILKGVRFPHEYYPIQRFVAQGPSKEPRHSPIVSWTTPTNACLPVSPARPNFAPTNVGRISPNHNTG